MCAEMAIRWRGISVNMAAALSWLNGVFSMAAGVTRCRHSSSGQPETAWL